MSGFFASRARLPPFHHWPDLQEPPLLGRALADLPRGERGTGGEASLFDRGGADRRRSRGHGLLSIDLPEGEGSVFPLMTRGVWLAQIPLVPKKARQGDCPASDHAGLARPIRWRPIRSKGKSLASGMIRSSVSTQDSLNRLSAIFGSVQAGYSPPTSMHLSQPYPVATAKVRSIVAWMKRAVPRLGGQALAPGTGEASRHKRVRWHRRRRNPPHRWVPASETVCR